MNNEYTLTQILSYIDTGADYKAVCLVCTQWYCVMSNLFNRGDVFADHLMTLLTLYPDANWNYWYVDHHIRSNYTNKCDLEILAQNPIVTQDDIHKYEYLKRYYFASNPNITWRYVQKFSLDVHFARLSDNKF